MRPLAFLLLPAFALLAFTPARSEEKPAELPEDWALRPIAKPAVPPTPAAHAKWVRTPVDAFVLEKLLASGLKPSPEADRRVLARRLYLDLTGLPPTPAELDAYLKDATPDAYEKLVDRLLASPRYGERWARHWLDVAHYADSHGQDQDRPRPNAWPYRDYVIRSLNEDKPYSRFVREQVAGDALYPDDPQALVATGFLAAGPWDESGLRDIQEDSIDRQIARYLDRDDIVTSTMTTFTGLTVHCARCHNHKFDPITQEDYYSLQAVFASTGKGDRPYDADPAVAKRRAALATELARVRGMKGNPDVALITPERTAEAATLEKEWADAASRWVVIAPSAVKSKDGSELKPLPDQSVLAGGMRPERDTYTVTLTTGLARLTGLRLEVLCDDTLPHRGPGRQDNGNLHLSEVRVTVRPKDKPDAATPVKIRRTVADFDQEGWGVARAVDGNPATAWGIYPQVGKPHQAVFEFDRPVGFDGGSELTVDLDQLHGAGHLIGRFRLAVTTMATVSPAEQTLPGAFTELFAVPADKRTERQRAELARLVEVRRLEREIAALPAQSKIYSGSNRFVPDGGFKPSPTPRPVHVLRRGDIGKPGKEAKPGTVEIDGLEGRFTVPDPTDDGQRRAALAAWLTDPKNPLTWRTIVNRVWHYHFGKGIVETPNDLGAMGGRPSHPELLDWLASEFRDSGGSLKKLHKLIVTSAIYRQSVVHDAAAEAKDAGNRLLWRMNRNRLDAETVRDAVLLVSGRLNDTMHGPPVQHFLMTPAIHVTPGADYDKFDVDADAARRRSIYRFIFRTRPDPMLEALDCPDASQSAPVRTVSVSAPQALVLWNNKFTLRHAEHLAVLAAKEAKELPDQVRVAAQRVLSRAPTAAESEAWSAYARKHGMANLCRVLLNSSEFLFAD